MRKKSKEDEQTLEELNFCSSPFASKMSVGTNQLNELNCSCFCHIINILLTELSRSVWKNLDLGRVYRHHCVRSVLTTSVKILPFRPPARLIRANYSSNLVCWQPVVSLSATREFQKTTTAKAINGNINKKKDLMTKTMALHVRYLSNRPQVSMGYKLINHVGC